MQITNTQLVAIDAANKYLLMKALHEEFNGIDAPRHTDTAKLEIRKGVDGPVVAVFTIFAPWQRQPHVGEMVMDGVKPGFEEYTWCEMRSLEDVVAYVRNKYGVIVQVWEPYWQEPTVFPTYVRWRGLFD